MDLMDSSHDDCICNNLGGRDGGFPSTTVLKAQVLLPRAKRRERPHLCSPGANDVSLTAGGLVS